MNFGDGIWGEKNRTVSFTIGAKHVSVADAGDAHAARSTTATRSCRPTR